MSCNDFIQNFFNSATLKGPGDALTPQSVNGGPYTGQDTFVVDGPIDNTLLEWGSGALTFQTTELSISARTESIGLPSAAVAENVGCVEFDIEYSNLSAEATTQFRIAGDNAAMDLFLSTSPGTSFLAFSDGVTYYEAPLPIDLNIEGGERFQVSVDFATNTATFTNVFFAPGSFQVNFTPSLPTQGILFAALTVPNSGQTTNLPQVEVSYGANFNPEGTMVVRNLSLGKPPTPPVDFLGWSQFDQGYVQQSVQNQLFTSTPSGVPIVFPSIREETPASFSSVLAENAILVGPGNFVINNVDNNCYFVLATCVDENGEQLPSWTKELTLPSAGEVNITWCLPGTDQEAWAITSLDLDTPTTRVQTWTRYPSDSTPSDPAAQIWTLSFERGSNYVFIASNPTATYTVIVT